jgi:lipoprotein-releasing system permease protein
MLPLRIAARFIRKSPGQSALIVGGIAVGIGVQIFVGTLITSLQASILDTTIGNASHITLSNADNNKPLRYTAAMRAVLTSDPRVKLVLPDRLVSVIFSKGSDSAPITVAGADPALFDRIYKLGTHTVAGVQATLPDEIMLGRSFTTKYKLKVGDPVVLVLPDSTQEKLRLSGIFDVGASTVNDRLGFTTSEFPRRALGMAANEYSGVQTQLFDPFLSQKVITDWEHLAPFRGVELKDWQVENQQLLIGLQGQSSSSYMIQVFVLIAVALGIASTLAISAVQKTRQIGILKAMGLTDALAGQVFLWEAALLGGGGTLLGLVFGLAFLRGFQLGPVLFPIVLQPGFVATSCAIGVAVALASSILPYRRTTRVDPIEVIQGG